MVNNEYNRVADIKQSKKGFTLVELVVVIAILAVLAAIAVPVITSIMKSSTEETDRTNARTYELIIHDAVAEVKSAVFDNYSASDTLSDVLIVKNGMKVEKTSDKIMALNTVTCKVTLVDALGTNEVDLVQEVKKASGQLTVADLG